MSGEDEEEDDEEDEEEDKATETILPAPFWDSVLTWEVEERVKAALEDQPGPSTCPQDRVFVVRTKDRGTTVGP